MFDWCITYITSKILLFSVYHCCSLSNTFHLNRSHSNWLSLKMCRLRSSSLNTFFFVSILWPQPTVRPLAMTVRDSTHVRFAHNTVLVLHYAVWFGLWIAGNYTNKLLAKPTYTSIHSNITSKYALTHTHTHTRTHKIANIYIHTYIKPT